MSRNYGDHKVPEPFKDEDKWLFLTKRQLVILVPAVIICGGLLIQTFRWNILPIGIILSVWLLIVAGAIMIVKIPEDRYLFGSGLYLEVMAFRVLKKKLPKNKVLYTKNYDNGYKDW